VVECLFCKHEALNSNHSPTKKNNCIVALTPSKSKDHTPKKLLLLELMLLRNFLVTLVTLSRNEDYYICSRKLLL
jgi:hypothetical protein